MADALIPPDEVRAICGGYSQPAKQLQELHRQGFWRARRSRLTGAIILERAHYEAVCRGDDSGVGSTSPEPVLQP